MECFFREAETNSLFCPEATREGSDGSARDPPPLHPPPPPESRCQRARLMKGSGGQVLPVEMALTATAVLVQSAAVGANNMSTTHLRGNLPHYGCDYFQITNQSDCKIACTGSSSGLAEEEL